MAKNGVIIVRVTKTQYERVRNNAEAKGYKTISSYIRALALEYDLNFEKKFSEIYSRVTNENLDKRENNNTKLIQFL